MLDDSGCRHLERYGDECADICMSCGQIRLVIDGGPVPGDYGDARYLLNNVAFASGAKP